MNHEKSANNRDGFKEESNTLVKEDTSISMSNHKIDIEEVELSVAKFMDLCYDHDLDGMKKHKEAFFEYVQCDFSLEDVVEQLFWTNPQMQNESLQQFQSKKYSTDLLLEILSFLPFSCHFLI